MDSTTKIIGHEAQQEWLQRAIARRGAHAFLLSGTANLGKRMVAEAIARQVLEHPALPLNEHPDMLLVLPEKETGRPSIGIDAAREVRRFLATTPLTAKRKVVIIDEAEYLTEPAGNALLKAIEEPAGEPLILLITQDKGRVLPTIRSRSLPVRFVRVSDEDLLAGLATQGYAKQAVASVLPLAAGRPGLARLLLEDADALQAAERRMQAITKLMDASAMVRLVYAARAAAAGESAVRALPDQWLAALQGALRQEPDAEQPRRAARATLQFAKQMNQTAVRPDVLLERALLSF
jgi:DNA polymerase-3 subunit delta'